LILQKKGFAAPIIPYPTGRFIRWDTFPSTSCLATIMLSRDEGLLRSIAYDARQCLGLFNPAFEGLDARYFVDVFLLGVNRRGFFVEMISSPLGQFFNRVYSGSTKELRVLPADPLDSKKVRFIDPFQNQVMSNSGFLDEFFPAVWGRAGLQKILNCLNAVRF
jgi:hypothetical protein